MAKLPKDIHIQVSRRAVMDHFISPETKAAVERLGWETLSFDQRRTVMKEAKANGAPIRIPRTFRGETGPDCPVCGKEITRADQCATWKGTYWHARCFEGNEPVEWLEMARARKEKVARDTAARERRGGGGPTTEETDARRQAAREESAKALGLK